MKELSYNQKNAVMRVLLDIIYADERIDITLLPLFCSNMWGLFHLSPHFLHIFLHIIGSTYSLPVL